MATSVDPDETARLIWICTVCKDIYLYWSAGMKWLILSLTVTTLMANSADDKLMIFFLFFFPRK